MEEGAACGSETARVCAKPDLHVLVRDAALGANQKRAELFYKEVREKQALPSEAPDKMRVPTETLVQLQVRLKKALAKAKDPTLYKLLQDSRKLFMDADLTVEATRDFLLKAKDGLDAAGQNDLSGLCGTLAKSRPDTMAKMPPTRLHENIYGRVFDFGIAAAQLKP